MDIETKRFRIRSAPGAGFYLTKKATGDIEFISQAPSANRLAMITESQFDREAAEAMESGAWN